MNRDYQNLRKMLEGNDPFVSRGHQVIALRQQKKTIPEWTKSDKEVRKVLLRSFPKLAVNQKQRDGAARWARVIHLYFRLQWTRTQVAEEIGITPNAVCAIVRNLKRVASGLRPDGSGRLGIKPRGRPKIHAHITTS